MPQQGLCSFPGIRQILGGNITLGHGISPSKAVIYMAPQDGFVGQIGELVFECGGESISFPDCKLDKFAGHRSRDGNTRWSVYLLDRRWKWQPGVGGGAISGYYNTRRGDNELIEETRQDSQELARLLLDEMGESHYQVDALPDDSFPVIEWDYAHPPEELARLCEQLGCSIVLGLDNRVRVVKLGEGEPLPEDEDVLEDTLTIDVPEMPDELVCVAGKTRYQADLELEAVGQDRDGDIKLLEDLSYFGGPEEFNKKLIDIPNLMNIDDPALREFARASVFRWYRIKDGFKLPGVDEKRIDRSRILPIEAEQVEKATVDDKDFNLPAWVYGTFYALDNDALTNNAEDPDPATIREGSPALYSGDFQIDRELGIVKFAEPTYRLERDKIVQLGSAPPLGFGLRPAKLFLRTAMSLRDKETRAWQHHEKRRKLGTKFGTRPRYLLKQEICKNVASKSSDNSSEVDEILDFYLDGAQREYQLADPRSITYAGFKAIELDGAVRQLTWSVGEDGKAYTRASYNREEANVDLSYADRRLSQRVIAAARDEERRKGTKQKDQAKAGPPT